jgi:hypothetical protein
MVARINRQLAAERIGRARRTLANRGGVGEREKAARKQPTVLGARALDAVPQGLIGCIAAAVLARQDALHLDPAIAQTGELQVDRLTGRSLAIREQRSHPSLAE